MDTFLSICVALSVALPGRSFRPQMHVHSRNQALRRVSCKRSLARLAVVLRAHGPPSAETGGPVTPPPNTPCMVSPSSQALLWYIRPLTSAYACSMRLVAHCAGVRERRNTPPCAFFCRPPPTEDPTFRGYSPTASSAPSAFGLLRHRGAQWQQMAEPEATSRLHSGRSCGGSCACVCGVHRQAVFAATGSRADFPCGVFRHMGTLRGRSGLILCDLRIYIVVERKRCSRAAGVERSHVSNNVRGVSPCPPDP